MATFPSNLVAALTTASVLTTAQPGLSSPPSLPANVTAWWAGAGSVAFDSASGKLLAVQTGPGPEGGPGATAAVSEAHRLFDVKVWPHHGALRSVPLEPDGWVLDVHGSAPPGSFVYTHAGASLQAHLLANQTNDALILTLKLHTMGPGNVTLAEVAFPQLSGVRATGLGQPGSRAELVGGGGVRGTGIRIVDPARNLSNPRLQWYKYKGVASPGVTQDPYPHAGTNWVALADPMAALCECTVLIFFPFVMHANSQCCGVALRYRHSRQFAKAKLSPPVERHRRVLQCNWRDLLHVLDRQRQCDASSW